MRATLGLLLSAALLFGCGSSTVSRGGSSGGSASSGHTSTSGASSSGGSHGASSGTSGHGTSGATGSGTTGDGAVTALAITPSSYTIDVGNGGDLTLQLTATATFASGATHDVAAAWSFNRLDLGTINQAGLLTASGSLGGDGMVTATFEGQTATAPISVRMHMLENPAGLTADQIAQFNSPDGAASGNLLYPEDRTVFALGLLPPEIMWEGGAAGDLYFIHLDEKDYEVGFYVTADPPSDFAMSPDIWEALTQTNTGAGDDVSVSITRLSGGVAHQPMTEHWTIAKGSLRGSIYYWAVNTGQLMKITPGATTPTVLFDSGDNTQLGTPAPANYDNYQPPWSTGGNSKRCVACHTVSKDGSTAVAIFERKDDASSPWGTVDLTAATPSVVAMTPYDTRVNFLGLTPDGMYAVENQSDMSLHLYNSHSAEALASALDGFADKVADPAFSPDGTHLAFSSNITGSYPVEFWRADLDVMDFDPGSATFTNRRNVADGGTSAIAFPSFTPDSRWVVFQQGDYSRAKYGTNSVGHDQLFMTDLAASVGTVQLSNASGVNLPAREQLQTYQPTVNPISVGGYTWVVFVSPRDYGNKMQSSSDPTYENRKQLWVAAIDANPQPGVDPSHPAFWLPGQDLTTINMSGYWALEACHGDGDSCTAGFECCSGYCDTTAGSCSSGPTGNGCSEDGDKCTTDTDCCAGENLACVGGFCALQLQ